MLTPELGDTLAAAHPSADTLTLLRLRRSTTADCLGDPGPDAHALETILQCAARAPDHRRVTPFRFIIFQGDARSRFGEVLGESFEKSNPDAEPARVEKEAQRFLRAPAVVAVVSAIDPDHRTPEWEQILTAGAVCQNMLIAASASGFAAQWLTEWYAYDAAVIEALGLGADERIAGFIYLGTAKADPKERARPILEDLVTHY